MPAVNAGGSTGGGKTGGVGRKVLLGRAKPCTDERYADRVTSGQTAAARFLHSL